MYKFAVSLTKTAYRDVFAVYDYIAGESGDQVLAEREAMGLFTAAGELETFPLKYPVIRRKKFARFHIRKMAFGNYVIFYRVNEKQKTVRIIRIFHARQNWFSYMSSY